MNSSKNKLNSKKTELFKPKPNTTLIKVCLRKAYLAKTEIFFVESTINIAKK